MSPEFEGPVLDPERGDIAPRRVKHLIVLPGGGEATEAAPSPEDEVDEQVEMPDQRGYEPDEEPTPGQSPSVRLPFGGGQVWAPQPAGAHAAAATAEAIPAPVSVPQSLKLKLRVISQSVTSTRTPGMPFIVFASVLVSLAVLALVVLHVMVDQASFRMDSLEGQVSRQDAALQQLRYAVSSQEAPARVAAGAVQLGLVPGSVIQTLTGLGNATTPTATATVGAPTGSPTGPQAKSK